MSKEERKEELTIAYKKRRMQSEIRLRFLLADTNIEKLEFFRKVCTGEIILDIPNKTFQEFKI